ncbi:MAG: HD domain-containing protein [Desulfuromonadaceae bacterium]|nr:HD domain-containing protein [Desulfuromonadaceae bacterium]MDD5107344.1 HD domain-containing protein [Desulfuromonadaceae bacterium]
MNDNYWRPISIDSIDPSYFPPVAMFIKSGDNYVLYKDGSRSFTRDDRQRLERSFTSFVYIRTGDMDEINTYLESHLTEILARDDIDDTTKGKILYQTSANCVIDMFESPETAANLERSRNLIKHIMSFVATSSHTYEALQAVAGHNFYIFAHSVQVTALSLLMHEKLFAVDADEMLDVGVGSLIHDYGMIFITDKILDKPDALSDVEYYKVKQHTQKGYEFLKNTGKFNEVSLTIIRHHHERFDGNGYPTGLKGDNIPRSAQIAAICDVYSALTLDRSYRKAAPHAEALQTMASEAKGGAFNPELFKSFEGIINLTKGSV